MPHIRKVYDGLVELEEELARLKGLVRQERDDIVRLDLAGMENRRARIEESYGRIGQLRNITVTDIEDACRQSGIEVSPNLTPLLAAVPKPDREQFVRIQKEVQLLTASVENELAINRTLLKDSLDFTSQSLGIFTTALKGVAAPTYGHRGRYVESAEQPRIICKEI